MTGVRQSRTIRHSQARAFCLQDRDRWIIESLGKMRFLTTTQLARLVFGGSRWAANKRLRKLLDAGLIRSWVRDLAEDNVYSLDRKGLGVLDDPDLGTNHTVARGLDGNLTHLLSINQARIALVLDLPAAGGEIAWWRSDWELRARFREPVIPDALFEVHWAGMERTVFALEVDNNTRSSRRFLAKILRYRSLAARGGSYGVSDFVTLVVGRDGRSQERYRLGVGHIRVDSRIWFAALHDFDSNGACAPIWTSVAGQEGYSLRDLSSLPYGKAGSSAVNPNTTEEIQN